MIAILSYLLYTDKFFHQELIDSIKNGNMTLDLKKREILSVSETKNFEEFFFRIIIKSKKNS